MNINETHRLKTDSVKTLTSLLISLTNETKVIYFHNIKFTTTTNNNDNFSWQLKVNKIFRKLKYQKKYDNLNCYFKSINK